VRSCASTSRARTPPSPSAPTHSSRARSCCSTDKGGKIRLTEKEAAIIKYLYRADQKVVTRDVLLEEVWGYNSGVTTHTLETHVYRLRQKIEADPSNAVDPGNRERRLQDHPVTGLTRCRKTFHPTPAFKECIRGSE
jgi:hypothetical protein